MYAPPPFIDIEATLGVASGVMIGAAVAWGVLGTLSLLL